MVKLNALKRVKRATRCSNEPGAIVQEAEGSDNCLLTEGTIVSVVAGPVQVLTEGGLAVSVVKVRHAKSRALLHDGWVLVDALEAVADLSPDKI